MAKTGKQTIVFEQMPYIEAAASVVGEKEGNGPLGRYFDEIDTDPKFGAETWEEAESCLQYKAAELALKKAGVSPAALDYIFAGDLLAQLMATSFGLAQLERPIFGLYGACSTMGESIILGSMALNGGYASHVIAMTSSHYAGAEKQFRFPLMYASQRPLSATWTVTGSGALVLGSEKPKKGGHVRIEGVTPGRIVDFGVKDSLNMGACMAPAAADTICRHLLDMQRQSSDYDAIITGDLGKIGQKILWDLADEQQIELSENHMDCGMLIYDPENQDTHAGGSGCGCCAVTLAAFILPKLESGEWKRVLFVPTGALHSTVSYNEGHPVPGIAHGVSLVHIS